MDRTIDAKLVTWKQSADRKPLLIFGARQVGKTYALERFGQRQFDSYVHLDFSRNAEAKSFFEGSLEPARIIAAIESHQRRAIAPEKTLLIFDEVQLCERALTSLKYFCEDAPEYCVTAAGSLLGVKLREQGSFPVGKVAMATLHPMSFEEYLWARGERRLGSLVEECMERFEPCPLHERGLELLREYLLVGGMPDVVRRFTGKEPVGVMEAYAAAREAQLEIDQAYVADIAKHAPSAEVPRILDVWRSIPGQLAKENHKFQYKAVSSGGRAAQYGNAVSWLSAAAIVSKCTRVSEPLAPLNAFVEEKAFKLYRADTGLLAASYEALPDDVLPRNDKGARFRGGLVESYVMQQLNAADVSPHYWGIPSKAEVDFVARDEQGDIIPIEVKSGANVRSNSLEAYRKKYDPPYVARLSTRNFGQERFVKSIPLYAACFFAKKFIRSPAYV